MLNGQVPSGWLTLEEAGLILATSRHGTLRFLKRLQERDGDVLSRADSWTIVSCAALLREVTPPMLDLTERIAQLRSELWTLRYERGRRRP